MEVFKQFGVQPILLAAQIVNFIVLLYLLKKLFYKPLLKVLEERKEKIAQSLKNAQEIEKRLLEIEDERDKKLKKAAVEAREILKDAGKQAADLIEEAQSRAEAQIKLSLKKNQEAMDRERDRLHQEIRNELAQMVVIGLEKVAAKIITKEDQHKIIEQNLKQL